MCLPATTSAHGDCGCRLYNVDGAVEAIDIALTLPTRSVDHVARLIDLKLEALAAANEAGFGFETIGLAITQAEPMPAQQTEFTPAGEDDDRTERCAALIDALRQRLGPQSVRRFEPVASHIPERAEILPPLNGEASAWPAMEQPRPLLLLPRAEPAKVTALVPDGPPRRFYWRGVTHEVKGAQGPERIAGEWWRAPPPHPPPLAGEGKEGARRAITIWSRIRGGQRFWLYREGIYGRETTTGALVRARAVCVSNTDDCVCRTCRHHQFFLPARRFASGGDGRNRH